MFIMLVAKQREMFHFEMKRPLKQDNSDKTQEKLNTKLNLEGQRKEYKIWKKDTTTCSEISKEMLESTSLAFDHIRAHWAWSAHAVHCNHSALWITNTKEHKIIYIAYNYDGGIKWCYTKKKFNFCVYNYVLLSMMKIINTENKSRVENPWGRETWLRLHRLIP